jgi:uncharacterized membrane protein YagU involved in acid resistance
MLPPKTDSGGYKDNPYKSLAAVDKMGHIGNNNVNLYYLSWMSQTLIMVLVYQVRSSIVFVGVNEVFSSPASR